MPVNTIGSKAHGSTWSCANAALVAHARSTLWFIRRLANRAELKEFIRAERFRAVEVVDTASGNARVAIAPYYHDDERADLLSHVRLCEAASESPSQLRECLAYEAQNAR